MSKQFWIFLAVGLVVIVIAVALMLDVTKGSHLELDGKILKVRVVALSESASLVIADFRVTNPSDIAFVVKDAALQLDPATGETIVGTRISKADVDNVFTYQRLAGPKFNDVLSTRDKIMPHRTVDHMVAARFDVPESVIEGRKALRLHLEELDGVVADLPEKK